MRVPAKPWSTRSSSSSELTPISINQLPESILTWAIFTRLSSIFDVARCRCVCKHWNSILSSSEFGLEWHEGGSRSPAAAASMRETAEVVFRATWMYDSGEQPSQYSRMRASVAYASASPSPSPQPSLSLSLSNSRHEFEAKQGSRRRRRRRAAYNSCWSTRIWELEEMASAHGLVCCRDEKRGRMVVSNPKTGKFRYLPHLPPPVANALGEVSNYRGVGRFVYHDLLRNEYKIFVHLITLDYDFEQCAVLFDSSTADEWELLPRVDMNHDRFFTGVRDGSVLIIKQWCTYATSQTDLDVVTLAYDVRSNSWDVLEVEARFPGNYHQHYRVASSAFVHCAAAISSGKEEHHQCRSRLLTEHLVVDHVHHSSEWYINLWELKMDGEKRVGYYDHMLSIKRNKRDWNSFGLSWQLVYVMRSDDKWFVALTLRDVESSVLIVYDVQRSSWTLKPIDRSTIPADQLSANRVSSVLCMDPSIWTQP